MAYEYKANANIGPIKFGELKFSMLSPLLAYKSYNSFVSSIYSLSDTIYNGNNRGNLTVAIGNSIQAADAFLDSIGKQNGYLNTASLTSSLFNIKTQLTNVYNDIQHTGEFKPNDIQQAIGDSFIAIGDGIGYFTSLLDRTVKGESIIGKLLPDSAKSSLANKYFNQSSKPGGSKILRNAILLQHEFNILGTSIKDYGNEHLGNSKMSIDDVKKIPGFFLDPKSYSGLFEHASRFIYSVPPAFLGINPWKGGTNELHRDITDSFEIVEKILKGELPFDPKTVGGFLEENLEDFFRWLFPGGFTPWKNTHKGKKYHIVDPLALDLDGNGIRTMASNQFSGSLFDHNGDGIRTASGWVGKEDGLLVYDRNGDGIINNGSELFGDATRLKNGGTAEHGFAALADLDDNGDGKIDAADKAFSSLRVWRDLNQDGISQEGELLTLEQAKVQSLSTQFSNTNRSLGDGNTLAQEGSYTTTDGQTRQMGDLLLANDPLFSRFNDHVELTAEQLQNPNLSGIGRLRDLREAAALSPALDAVLRQYAAAETKEQQTALLAQLAAEWGKTDARYGSYTPTLTAATEQSGTAGQGVPLTPSQLQALRNGKVNISPELQAEFDALQDKIRLLDAFTGEDSRTLSYGTLEQVKEIIGVANTTYAQLEHSLYQACYSKPA